MLTLDQAKDVLSITGTSDDGNLGRVLDASVGLIESEFGAILQRQADHAVEAGGCRVVALPSWPVASLALVTDDDEVVPAANYVLAGFPWSPCVQRTDGQAFSGSVAITYTVGRYATAAEVEGRWPAATAIVLENLWQQYRPTFDQPAPGEFAAPVQSFPRFGMPRAVTQLLWDYAQPPVIA